MTKFLPVILTMACVFEGGLAARSRSGAQPLAFETNQGQSESQVKFLARGRGYTLFLTNQGATLAFENRALRMTLLGALATAHATGIDPLPGKANYFIGNNPAKWHRNISTYSRIEYKSVYPGVDLVYYGNEGQLEYDFVVAPGADPSRIGFRLEGDTVRVSPDGDLVAGQARFHKPVVYQQVGSRRVSIDGSYVLRGGGVGFRLAKYDRSRPLVIDPVLSYSTYFGGSGSDLGAGIAVDSTGNAYVTGYAESANFPTTPGAYQTALNGPSDLYVAKLSPTGALLYSTLIGGSNQEWTGETIS